MKFKFTRSRRRDGLAILGGSLAFLGAADAALYMENFDGLALGPFVSDSESGGTGSDWTSTLPTGWSRDNTTTPAPTGADPLDGPDEFFGWNFFNASSWIATAGDQGRSEFMKGTGIVAVADPDEYDDQAPGISADMFNVFMQTPTINLGAVDLSTVEISFDSSFRPYSSMTALVDLSFNGGTDFVNALTYTTANSGGNSSLTRANESVTLMEGVDFTATGTDLVVRFGMTNAGNDWWWAVDNLEVVPEPGTALLGALGLLPLLRRRRTD